MKKRVLSMVLVVCLILTIMPMAVAAERTFVINGQTITRNTGWVKGSNCSAYVSNLIANIYPKKPGITIQFTSTYNTLRNKSAAEREITAAHVKEFIQSVQPGARIRVCESSDTTSNDSDNSTHGHTMLLAEKNDAAGTFTTLESVVIGGAYTPKVYDYTYESFAQKFHDKYASEYSAGYNAKYFYYIYDLQHHFGTVDSTTSSGPSTLTFKSPNAPKTLKQGSYFGLTGTVTSNYNITSVYGRIKNSSNTTVDSYQQKNINSKSFSIAYSGLDDNLELNLLSPGAYYLTYEATDASGTTVSWKSDTFYIQSSTPCKSHTKGTYKFAEAKHPHYQYWECAICGNNFTDGSTKKLDSCTTCNPPKPNCDKGHTWGSWKTTKAATCVKEGLQERKCSVCGTTAVQNSAALGHEYKVSKETDTYIRYTCFYCNDSYTVDKEANCDKGHTWGEWEVIEEPTCVVDGKGQRVCKICGEIEQLPVKAYKHNWSDWSTVEEPSCGLEGLQERVCELCEEIETKVIDALGHDYRVKQETDASILYVCRNCGDSYMEEKEPEAVDKSGMIHFTNKNRYSDGLFRDVKSSDWFNSNVATVYSMGLMKGRENNIFAPRDNMTLAEVVTLAARVHSIYHTGSGQFPHYDGGNWYDPYVNYARDNGIIYENYDFGRPATREQVVHILAKALPNVELTNTVGYISFADNIDITYMADVRLLSGAGVIVGYQENGLLYFKPLEPITRAQVAAIVGRMVQPSTRLGQ